LEGIWQDYSYWGGYDSAFLNFKYASFEVLSLLEYPYLLSAYCEPMDGEIEESQKEIVRNFGGPDGDSLMIQNFWRWFGSIMLQLTAIDDCFSGRDGECLGSKLGTAAKYIYDVSVV
jgi:hypothetical protein